MEYKTITLSEDAFLAVLTLAECSGKYNLPQGYGKGNDDMQRFVKGRDEICAKGFAELDFDGNINPTRVFARAIYSLPRATSYMMFGKEWFLRGPIELLHILMDGENCILTQCNTDDLMEWVREKLYRAEEGNLLTEAMGKRKEDQLMMTSPITDERAEMLTEHVAMFFEKEAPNA